MGNTVTTSKTANGKPLNQRSYPVQTPTRGPFFAMPDGGAVGELLPLPTSAVVVSTRQVNEGTVRGPTPARCNFVFAVPPREWHASSVQRKSRMLPPLP